jgi:spore germination protein KA
MPTFRLKDKQKVIDQKVSKINESLEKFVINKSLKSNIEAIKKIFVDNDIFIIREIDSNNDSNIHYAIAYCNGLVNGNTVNENIIKPLMLSKVVTKDNIDIDVISKNVILINEVKKTDKIKEIVEDVTYGDVVLFIDGISEVLILNTKLLEKRAITEPENEKMLVGPREGFTESMLTNISLVCRKLRTNELKLTYVTLGDRTNTKGCICYLDSIVNKQVLSEFKKRLNKIKIDGVLDTNYITELTKDKPWSLFRTTNYTERPD